MEPLDIFVLVMAIVLVAVFVAILGYLYLIAPSSCSQRRKRLERFKTVKYAHRGLHGCGVAENSMTAFRYAKDKGFGIELDVRLSKDGQLVVFHDPTLDRVCKREGRVIDFTADELGSMALADTSDTIPTFKAVLDLIEGNVPLLIEIKQDTDESGVADVLARELEGYQGEYIVESFNPLALRRMKKLSPEVLIGILSSEFTKQDAFKGKILYFLLEKLLLNFLMRPDFIAYDKTGHRLPGVRFIRHAFSTPLIAWTIHSEEEETEAVGCGFDTVIFEGYVPEKTSF